MPRTLGPGDRVGLLHPSLDAHTLGLSALASLLGECGLRAEVAGSAPCAACLELTHPAQQETLAAWVRAGAYSVLGFSYRLDPLDAERLCASFLAFLRVRRLFADQGGTVRHVYFAGLPEACERVRRSCPRIDDCFHGDETPAETLRRLGLPETALPARVLRGSRYDELRLEFARELVRGEGWRAVGPVDRRGSTGFGTRSDGLVARLEHGDRLGLPPLLRAHVGPYFEDRRQALETFQRWCRELARDGLLDVLSIGTSQLSQSDFGGDWQGRTDGGGVPLQCEQDFVSVYEASRPLLLRSYAGTTRIPLMASMLERSINTAWHALSLWWFCRLDGRGPNPLALNLLEHEETLRFIARSGKPFEANVSHHFAFRGADDVSYAVSAFLAARLAKALGVRTYVLQVMLNTPKSTWGVQDLAKARVTLELVRSLEDASFRVVLQPRGGLDYFSPEPSRAMAQLAAVTALMDDIEPDDPRSPGVIHVVSHSEGTHLATPTVVNESLQITRHALAEWRRLRQAGEIPHMGRDAETALRTEHLRSEARVLIAGIDSLVPAPSSARGLHEVFRLGFLPVPHLWQCREEYPNAVAWTTRQRDGGVVVEDQEGQPLSAARRVALIRDNESKGVCHD